MKKQFVTVLAAFGVATCALGTESFENLAEKAVVVQGKERESIFREMVDLIGPAAKPQDTLHQLWLLYFLAENDEQRVKILSLAQDVPDESVRVLLNAMADIPSVEKETRQAQKASADVLAKLPNARADRNGKVAFPGSFFDGRSKYEKFEEPPAWVGRWGNGTEALDLSVFPTKVIAGKVGGVGQVKRDTVLGFEGDGGLIVLGPNLRAEWQKGEFLVERNGRKEAWKRQPVGVTGKDKPAGAKSLLSAHEAMAWQGKSGNMEWAVSPEGVMEMKQGAGTHNSKESFGDVRLYVEFRHAFNPEGINALRGNSGIYLQSNYEVQMTEAFAVDPSDSLSGAIYRLAAPKLAAVAPPMEWQSMEIVFHTPRYDGNGQKTQNARMSVWQNGQQIHDNVEIPKASGGGVGEGPQPLPILLQGHGGLLQFRNIWVEPLTNDAG